MGTDNDKQACGGGWQSRLTDTEGQNEVYVSEAEMDGIANIIRTTTGTQWDLRPAGVTSGNFDSTPRSTKNSHAQHALPMVADSCDDGRAGQTHPCGLERRPMISREK